MSRNRVGIAHYWCAIDFDAWQEKEMISRLSRKSWSETLSDQIILNNWNISQISNTCKLWPYWLKRKLWPAKLCSWRNSRAFIDSKMLIIHKIDVKDIGHLTILNVIVTYGGFSLWIFAHSRLLLTLYIGLEMLRFFVPVFLVCTLLSRKCSFGYFYLYSRLFHEYL